MHEGARLLTLAQLNAAPAEEFVRLLDGTYEHSPWVAARTLHQRPFATLAALQQALVSAVRSASRDEQLALIRAHPELAGKAMVSEALTAESTNEQSKAGLADCTPAEFARLQQLNAAYNAKFGWPFMLAVRGPRSNGLPRAEIIETFARRLNHHPEVEFAEALHNIHRVAQIRLNEKFGFVPQWGRQAWDCAELLAQHSEDPEVLTVTYLSEAHQACQGQLLRWLQDCGFDEARIDAVGNVVGLYHGALPDAPRLLTGSHYDTVRNAGKYDGRLGIFVPMVAVRELALAGRRLPFGIEVVGFAEEEGQRYKATFLGSSALTGSFEPAWLDQVDAQWIAMRDAMRSAGLPARMEDIAALEREAARYLGFVEVHIEQGPVLNALNLPLGVVTSINGSVRYLGEVQGQASHAGTTPMGQRRDAACAVAELALFVERRAATVPDIVGTSLEGAAVTVGKSLEGAAVTVGRSLEGAAVTVGRSLEGAAVTVGRSLEGAAVTVGTVGLLDVPKGSINVVPGRCRFSLDLRATTNAARDALAEDVLAEFKAICARRGVTGSLEESLRASAAPSDPAWQARWEQAVAALGLPVHRLPSGAGHDAMKLHELLPQAMLFVRGSHGGISHNPLESTTDDDTDLAVRAFIGLLDGLAKELA